MLVLIWLIGCQKVSTYFIRVVKTWTSSTAREDSVESFLCLKKMCFIVAFETMLLNEAGEEWRRGGTRPTSTWRHRCARLSRSMGIVWLALSPCCSSDTCHKGRVYHENSAEGDNYPLSGSYIHPAFCYVRLSAGPSSPIVRDKRSVAWRERE